MSNEELKNSPLHGLSTEVVLTELVEFYGWAVLDAAVDLKCFRIEPTIPSCLTFLKKAEWARNRVEDFYLYSFKGMPKSSENVSELKPREQGFPNGVLPKNPCALTVEMAEAARWEKVAIEEEIEREKEREQSTFRSRFSRPRN